MQRPRKEGHAIAKKVVKRNKSGENVYDNRVILFVYEGRMRKERERGRGSKKH